MMSKFFYNLNKLGLILIVFGLFFLYCFILAQIYFVPASASSDVIAIRVIPNHQHYSAIRWYKEQGFTGSPQSLIIDGYEAIRDGRTIYVNAANIVGSGAGATLYTNIYLLSYSQSAEPVTIEIVNQLLQHWHFNTDLSASNQCVDSEGNIGDDCLIDSDCPANEYCNSDKAKTTRDTRRLADLAEIKIALKNYKNNHNRYPDLSSGSYLPNNTLSTWPSWQGNLAQELNITLPTDPINRLGQCDGHDQVTCWNEQNKKFADADLADPEINLPDSSHAYVYTAALGGASSIICAVMESGLINTIEQGACAGSESREHAVATENNPPQFTGVNLPGGSSGESYEGFISATDSDGDSLIWTFTPGACLLWNNLRQDNIAVANQKAIRADNAGQAGTPSCSFNVTINDNRGGIVNQNYTIDVININLPEITAIDGIAIPPPGPINFNVTIGNDLSFIINAQEADNQYPLDFIFTGQPAGFNSTGNLEFNEHDYNVSGLVEDTTAIYNTTVVAYDPYLGESNLVNFDVTVENQAPNITSTPVTNATACLDYVYDVIANDPDGHSIEYFDLTNSLPANLSIDQTTGEIIGQPQNTGVFSIQIEAQDQYYSQTIVPYSAESVQNYNLSVGDEVFTVTAPADNFFYVAPDGVPIANLYYLPVTFFGAPVSSAVSPVNWSRTTNPAIPSGLTIVINSATGEINASASNNTNNPGFYDVTVSAANNCGAGYSDGFTLEVRANEWCGDTTVQAGFGEECDSLDGAGTSISDQYECDSICQWTSGWCGDSIIQAGFGEECDSLDGAGTSISDQYECDSGCQWTSGWCGDSIIQAGFGEECDTLGGGGTSSDDQYVCDSGCQWTGGWVGDSDINGTEECDSADLDGETCLSLGFAGGDLLCDTLGFFDLSGCWCEFNNSESNFDGCVYQ